MCYKCLKKKYKCQITRDTPLCLYRLWNYYNKANVANKVPRKVVNSLDTILIKCLDCPVHCCLDKVVNSWVMGDLVWVRWCICYFLVINGYNFKKIMIILSVNKFHIPIFQIFQVIVRHINSDCILSRRIVQLTHLLPIY